MRASWIAENGTARVNNKRRGFSTAMDLKELALAEVGIGAELSLEDTDGSQTSLDSGETGALPMIYITRRNQIKFAWVDDKGDPLRGSKRGDISAISIRK